MSAPDTLEFCPGGGILVGADYTIPEHPWELHRDDRLPETLGCNRLVCTRCGVPVRNAPHFGSRPGFGARETEVYETEDWRTVAQDVLLETPGYIGRFYACRCSRHVECGVRLLDDPDPEPFDEALPWRCAGHPPMPSPSEVDGVRIDEATSFTELVSRSFRGDDPPRARPRERALPTGWITKLYFLLGSSPLQERLVRAIASALESGDIQVRSCALFFFSRFSELHDAEAVSRVAMLYPELFHGLKDTTRVDELLEVRLRSFVAKRLGMRADGRRIDPLALELARAEVYRPGDTVRVLLALASSDETWLVAHAVEIVRARPERWKDVIESFVRVRSEKTDTVVRALLRAGLVEPEALREFAKSELESDGRRVVLKVVGGTHALDN